MRILLSQLLAELCSASLGLCCHGYSFLQVFVNLEAVHVVFVSVLSCLSCVYCYGTSQPLRSLAVPGVSESGVAAVLSYHLCACCYGASP